MNALYQNSRGVLVLIQLSLHMEIPLNNICYLLFLSLKKWLIIVLELGFQYTVITVSFSRPITAFSFSPLEHQTIIKSTIGQVLGGVEVCTELSISIKMVIMNFIEVLLKDMLVILSNKTLTSTKPLPLKR